MICREANSRTSPSGCAPERGGCWSSPGRNRGGKARRASSLRQSYLSNERDETRILAKRVERRVDFEPYGGFGTVVVHLLEVLHCLVIIAKRGVNTCQEQRQRVRAGGASTQFSHYAQRLIAIAGARI